MPIKPERRRLYPFDWPELSAAVRFRRAKGRCERCAKPHGKHVTHLGDGRWWDPENAVWRDAKGRAVAKLPPPEAWNTKLAVARVVLACAHLDHDPTNNVGRNLVAVCQRCHLEIDRDDNLLRRRITVRLRWACGDLFTGMQEP